MKSNLKKSSVLEIVVLVSMALAPLGAAAQEELRSRGNNGDALVLTDPAGRAELEGALCLMVESAAKANELPLEFFAHIIWQESHFRSEAIGPATRSGRARGIAQFMPDMARERGLLDPFNPVQALPKAAEFLAELRNQFGNLGLAAAAYNAGPRRVQDWLAGASVIPAETRNYVLTTTGRGLEDWVAIGKNGKTPDDRTKATCRELVALFRQEPNPFVSKLTQSVGRAIAKPWGVQMATGFNRNGALAAYASVVKDLASVLGERVDPTREPILVRSRGTSSFYQVRIGADTRSQADKLCRHIRLAHGTCLVKRRDA